METFGWNNFDMKYEAGDRGRNAALLAAKTMSKILGMNDAGGEY